MIDPLWTLPLIAGVATAFGYGFGQRAGRKERRELVMYLEGRLDAFSKSNAELAQERDAWKAQSEKWRRSAVDAAWAPPKRRRPIATEEDGPISVAEADRRTMVSRRAARERADMSPIPVADSEMPPVPQLRPGERDEDNE